MTLDTIITFVIGGYDAEQIHIVHIAPSPLSSVLALSFPSSLRSTRIIAMSSKGNTSFT
jgi:hypothetical protein